MSLILRGLASTSSLIPKKIRMKLTDKTICNILDKHANIELVNNEIISKRSEKPTIYIGNHLSNIDGVILNSLLKNNNVAFMAGEKLSENSFTSLVLETINTNSIKPNTADRVAIRKAIKHLKENKSIFIFPEGTRSRSGSMIAGKKGFLLIAKKANVKVVPVGIEGTEKLMPIKSDLDKETFNNADVKITFGEPFSLPERADKNNKDWKDYALEYSMKKIAELLQPKYQGVYRK